MAAERLSVTILMATYNGGKYLDEQIASIYSQNIDHINILSSDDNSTDDTKEILYKWKNKWDKGEFEILDGPCNGYVENFKSLWIACDWDTEYFAFSDQDDIWMPDKLSTAINAVRQFSEACPVLYCSRTILVDEVGNVIGFSPKFRRPASFRNAIVQNIGGGNTMVLNRAAFELVAESAPRGSFVSHDWWCYILITGVGGHVLYDPVPRIAYRQHGGNLIGKNTGLRAKMQRIRGLFGGQFQTWNNRNLAALQACADLTTDEAKRIVAELKDIRAGGLRKRVSAFQRAGLYRQTTMGTLALLAAVVLGKM